MYNLQQHQSISYDPHRHQMQQMVSMTGSTPLGHQFNLSRYAIQSKDGISLAVMKYTLDDEYLQVQRSSLNWPSEQTEDQRSIPLPSFAEAFQRANSFFSPAQQAQTPTDGFVWSASDSEKTLSGPETPSPPLLVQHRKRKQPLDPNKSAATGKRFKPQSPLIEQRFSDLVGATVIKKYADEMKAHQADIQFKFLAGIVMSKGGGQLEVVSFATGTKVYMNRGDAQGESVVRDLHAEALARRGFVSFLYAQLEKFLQRPSESIFWNPTGVARYQLRPGIEFHMYLSRMPCGDACVSGQAQKEKQLGRLQVKLMAGDRTVPVAAKTSGAKFMSVSCSDKIARWSVLGLQGCLLAALIEPVYLSTVVVGYGLAQSHMERAIGGRIADFLPGLPPPYKLTVPKIGKTSFKDPRVLISPSHCINWNCDGQKLELLDPVTGRPDSGGKNGSQVNRKAFFNRFKILATRLRTAGMSGGNRSYGETKAAVRHFQIAKERLMGAFADAGLGEWPKKPIEAYQFW